MVRFDISINSAEFTAAMASIKRKVTAEVKNVTKLTAAQLVTDAKLVVPVDTGRLRDSIKYELIDDGLAADVSANTEYAAFVEFGTSRQRAQPYLVPSWEKIRPLYLEELAKAISNLS